MISTLLNNLDLVANVAICVLCFSLGYFVSTVLAESRHFKFQKAQMKEEIVAAGESGRSSEDAVEIERLHGEVASQLEAMKLKDHEMEKLIEQVNRAADERQKLEAQFTESLSEKGEFGRLKSELDRLRSEFNTKIEEVKTKDKELSRFAEERRAEEGRIAQSEKIIADYSRLEKTVQDQKKSFYDIEQRIREIRIKLRVISEKARESVELVAAFAEGKEFDEFRKSVHLDELTQRYEDQIKDLKKTD